MDNPQKSSRSAWLAVGPLLVGNLDAAGNHASLSAACPTYNAIPEEIRRQRSRS